MSLPDFPLQSGQFRFGIIFAMDMSLPNSRGLLRLKTSIAESKNENVCPFNNFVSTTVILCEQKKLFAPHYTDFN
jgi:hypothetical protein